MAEFYQVIAKRECLDENETEDLRLAIEVVQALADILNLSRDEIHVELKNTIESFSKGIDR